MNTLKDFLQNNRGMEHCFDGLIQLPKILNLKSFALYLQ